MFKLNTTHEKTIYLRNPCTMYIYINKYLLHLIAHLKLMASLYCFTYNDLDLYVYF